MSGSLQRRLKALEIVGNQDIPVTWGPRYKEWPAMTVCELRRLLGEIHRSGAGRLEFSYLRGR